MSSKPTHSGAYAFVAAALADPHQMAAVNGHDVSAPAPVPARRPKMTADEAANPVKALAFAFRSLDERVRASWAMALARDYSSKGRLRAGAAGFEFLVGDTWSPLEDAVDRWVMDEGVGALALTGVEVGPRGIRPAFVFQDSVVAAFGPAVGSHWQREKAAADLSDARREAVRDHGRRQPPDEGREAMRALADRLARNG